jgi:hypothetical protein
MSVDNTGLSAITFLHCMDDSSDRKINGCISHIARHAYVYQCGRVAALKWLDCDKAFILMLTEMLPARR